MNKRRVSTFAAVLILTLFTVQIALADSSYVVAPGDVLWKIAERFGVSQQSLINANSIENANFIYAGQTLSIPDGAATTTVQSFQATTAAAPRASSSGSYTVRAGDTLSQIAANHGVSTASLASANSIVNHSLIYTGQILSIPNGNSVAAPSTPAVVAAPTQQQGTGGEKWIDVNLTTQTLVAYEGDVPVYRSAISSGLSQFPTVTGQFRVWHRTESQTMNGYALGYDYYLENVPHVMYFHGNFAIHGAYWHNNFGTPMSHGCVNAPLDVAEWLFNWSSYNTLVNVHY